MEVDLSIHFLAIGATLGRFRHYLKNRAGNNKGEKLGKVAELFPRQRLDEILGLGNDAYFNVIESIFCARISFSQIMICP